MLTKYKISNKILKFSKNTIYIFLIIIFSFLVIASFFLTSKINPENIMKENIIYEMDNVFLSSICIILFIIVFHNANKYLEHINHKFLITLLTIYTFILGFCWVINVKSIPPSDSGTIIETASNIINNNFSNLTSQNSYFKFYPFQLGTVFIYEILIRFLGTNNFTNLGIVNVLFLCSSFIGLADLTRILFKNKIISNLSILFLGGCLQAIFFCTSLYGNIIGISLAIWSIYLMIKFIKTHTKYMLFLSVIFMSISIIANLNNYIFLIATCIVLILYLIKKRKAVYLISIILLISIPLITLKLIIINYEIKSNTNFNSGVPMILQASMGLQESSKAPGWYNKYTIETFENNNFDTKSSSKIAIKNINKRIYNFKSNPNYAINFFAEKILSQWIEPSYESIWINQINSQKSQISNLIFNIYEGNLNKILSIYFNLYQQIIFIGFLASVSFLTKKNHLIPVIIPLVILGGFIYHLIFEAKSQYILTYFVLIIPYSSHGLYNIYLKFKP